MKECGSLGEVREEIDRVDAGIVALLGERTGYVRQVGRFKGTVLEVRASERVEQVVARVRRLAIEAGTDPDLVERVYRVMIEGFTDMQVREKLEGEGR